MAICRARMAVSHEADSPHSVSRTPYLLLKILLHLGVMGWLTALGQSSLRSLIKSIYAVFALSTDRVRPNGSSAKSLDFVALQDANTWPHLISLGSRGAHLVVRRWGGNPRRVLLGTPLERLTDWKSMLLRLSRYGSKSTTEDSSSSSSSFPFPISQDPTGGCETPTTPLALACLM